MNKDELKTILDDMTYLRLEEAEFIYDFLIKLPEKGRLLELGTGKGHSTVFFSKVLPEWTIYTVDAYGSAGIEPLIWGLHEGKIEGKGVEDTFEYLKTHNTKNVIQIISSFKDLFWELEVDVLFIDGSHYYESVKEDFEKYSKFVKKNGIIIFDDYNYNWGVKEFVDGLEGWKIYSTNTTAIIEKL